MCSLNSQISPASENRFTMKAPNPLGQVSILSFPFLRGIAMGLFARKFFERVWFGGICRALRNLDDYVLRDERSSNTIN